jgi:hypothetical protein
MHSPLWERRRGGCEPSEWAGPPGPTRGGKGGQHAEGKGAQMWVRNAGESCGLLGEALGWAMQNSPGVRPGGSAPSSHPIQIVDRLLAVPPYGVRASDRCVGIPGMTAPCNVLTVREE